MDASAALQEQLAHFRQGLHDAGFSPLPAAEVETWAGAIPVEWLDPVTQERHAAAHRVAITLPTGFPYAAPVVLSQDDPPLETDWHLNPGDVLGRSDGLSTLCLGDPDTFWRAHHTAHILLNRIHDWLIFYHTGAWPSNSDRPDLNRYLSFTGHAILGNDWQPPHGQWNGKFTFWWWIDPTRAPTALLTCPADARTLPALPECRLTEPIGISRDELWKREGIWFRLPHAIMPVPRLADLFERIDAALDHEPGAALAACKRLSEK